MFFTNPCTEGHLPENHSREDDSCCPCPTNVPIYGYPQPVDLSKGFDGLCRLFETVFGRNIFDGHLDLYDNKRPDRNRAFGWDVGGLVIWHKRLEHGTREIAKASVERLYMTMNSTQLAMLMEGVPLDHARCRKRMAGYGHSTTRRSG